MWLSASECVFPVRFGSDGSFLEMMEKMDPRALEQEMQKTKEAAAQAAKEAAAAKAWLGAEMMKKVMENGRNR